jgi:WD40-like Beta Propeller Repeat
MNTHQPAPGSDIGSSGIPPMLRSRTARLLRQVAVVGLVAVVVMALVTSLHGGVSTPTAAPYQYFAAPTSVAFSIVTERDDLTCLRDGAWRQDGRYLAVLGTMNDCPLTSYEPGIINIYSGDGKTLIRQIKPDGSIFSALHAEMPEVSAATPTVLGAGKAGGHYTSTMLYYHAIRWSPDMQLLGATFTAITAFQPLQEFDGLLIISTSGTHPQVLLRQEQPSDLYSYLYLVWGVDAVGLVTARSAQVPVPADVALNVTPALVYSWNEDGTLAPVPNTLLAPQPEASMPLAPGPIGNPDGGATFTSWQAGTLTDQSYKSQNGLVTVFTWSSTFPAWSPDGRYFIAAIALSGRFQPLGFTTPSKTLLASQQESLLPVFPVRDKGLQQVLTDLRHQPEGASAGVSLAWSVSGMVLAAFGANGINIDFFDCTTGRLLARLPNPGSTFAVDNGILSWSPDDRWLLMASGEIINVAAIHP